MFIANFLPILLSLAVATPNPACDDLLTSAQTRGVRAAVRAGWRVQILTKRFGDRTKVLALVGAAEPGAVPPDLARAFDRVAVDGDQPARDPLLRAGAALRAWLRGPRAEAELPRFATIRDQAGADVIDLRDRPAPWRERVAQHAVSLNVGLAALAMTLPWLVPDSMRPYATLGVAAVIAYQAAGLWLGRVARVRGDRVFASAFPLAARADELHHAGIVARLAEVFESADVQAVVTALPNGSFDAVAARLAAVGYTPLMNSAPEPAAKADLSILKITPELMELAAAEPKYHRMISAFSTIFDQLTKENLVDLATALIESPVATAPERRALAANPYFLENPGARTETSELNLIVIRRLLGADLEPYALGLLATMITPNRVSRTITLDDLQNWSPAKRGRRLQALTARPEYRAAAIEVLELALTRPRVLELMNERVAEYDVTYANADLERARGELRAGKTLTIDAVNIIGHAVHAIQFDVLTSNFALGIGLDLDNVAQVRDRFLIGARAYFRRVLPIKTSLTAVTVFMGALLYDAPVPMSDHVLKQSIVDSALRALMPLKAERSRAAPVMPATPAPTPRAATEFVPVDRFVPQAESRRKRPARVEPMDVDAPAAAPAVPAIAPEFDLRRLADAGEMPVFDRRYEVIFSNGPDDVVQHVRFSSRALKWMVENPAIARQIVRTVCLGGSDDDTPGIKRLRTKSRRYKGQLFELKFRSDFRPFVIFEKTSQTWQILDIPHKDDQDRASRWVHAIDAA